MIPIEIVDRHILLPLEGGYALLDTGSPFDMGRGGTAILGDEPWTPPSDHVAVLDAATSHLGVSIDWLIGYPTLSRRHLLVDWAARVARFSRSSIALAGATRIPIDTSLRVPLLEAIPESGIPIRAVLDTGAALSYAPQSAIAGKDRVRTERDFHPTVGSFEVEVWRIGIAVGGRAIDFEVGVLPAQLARRLGSVSGGWILGSDFFRDRAVGIAYPDGAVLDAPSC